MLEKPDLPDEALAACLLDEYALLAVDLAFLPLGADPNTTVYRVVADAGSEYFLKLRSGDFDDSGVVVPRLLGERGLTQVICPIAAEGGRLWTTVERFAVILYPVRRRQ